MRRTRTKPKAAESTPATPATKAPAPPPDQPAAKLTTDNELATDAPGGWAKINATDKPFISPTQFDMICKCGEQYRRRYIEGDVMPPGIAAHRGTGVHSGAKLNFRQKRDSHRDLKASDIIDASVAAFDAAVERKGFALTAEEKARGAKAVIAEQRDWTAILARIHATVQAPDYQPVVTEEKVRIVLPNSSHDLLGIVDLQDTIQRVTDFKTAKRKKSQRDVDESVQLTVYAAAAHVNGTPASAVQLDTLVTKKEPERQLLTSHRDATDFRALVARTNAVIATIKAGTFLPAAVGSWWCSPDWCGYWATCPYVNAERQALLSIE